MSGHKFIKGPAIPTTIEAVIAIMAGHWLYHNHKPLSPKWLINWPLAQIETAVKFKSLHYAISAKTKEEYK